MVAQSLSREDSVASVSHIESEGKRRRDSDCYRFTAWKNIFQNYELITSLEFFFMHMSYIMKDHNAFCIAFISLKLLLSKSVLVSHFVGEPNLLISRVSPKK